MDAATLILTLASLLLLASFFTALKSAEDERGGEAMGPPMSNHAMCHEIEGLPIGALHAGPVSGRTLQDASLRTSKVSQPAKPVASPATARFTAVQFTELIVMRQRL